MPCQEFGSLSTWEARIRAPADCKVVMSADHQASGAATQNGEVLVILRNDQLVFFRHRTD